MKKTLLFSCLFTFVTLLTIGSAEAQDFKDLDESPHDIVYFRTNKIAPPSSFSVAIHNDSLWVVSRTTPDLTLQLGETLLEVNGKKPNDLFTSYCDYVMNIGRLFKQESLKVQKMDGTIVNISIK